jgi:hypothetical protein
MFNPSRFKISCKLVGQIFTTVVGAKRQNVMRTGFLKQGTEYLEAVEGLRL